MHGLELLWARCEGSCSGRVKLAVKNHFDPPMYVQEATRSDHKPGPTLKPNLKGRIWTSFVPDAKKINARRKVKLPQDDEVVEDQEIIEDKEATQVALDLWEIVMALKDDSGVYHDQKTASPDLRDDHKALFIEQACCTSLQSLKQCRGTWRRWATYCEKENMVPRQATKTEVALWLRSLESRGV